jgi:SAM-dependent methyltransferase
MKKSFYKKCAQFFTGSQRDSDKKRNQALTDLILNRWQEAFCKWNAERLQIAFDEAVNRLTASWNAFPGGHAGREYKKYCSQSYEAYRVVFDDSSKEAFGAYKFHAWMHLRRMISYGGPTWQGAHPIMNYFQRGDYVRIIDFGCGLAQQSISLLEALRQAGADGELILCDIPTVRFELLQYIAKEFGIRASFLECSQERPIPDLPACEVIIATEIFEHLHDPAPYLNAMHTALCDDGFLVAELSNHNEEFMHVTPNLAFLHEELMYWGYDECRPQALYQKHPKFHP